MQKRMQETLHTSAVLIEIKYSYPGKVHDNVYELLIK